MSQPAEQPLNPTAKRIKDRGEYIISNKFKVLAGPRSIKTRDGTRDRSKSPPKNNQNNQAKVPLLNLN